MSDYEPTEAEIELMVLTISGMPSISGIVMQTYRRIAVEALKLAHKMFVEKGSP